MKLNRKFSTALALLVSFGLAAPSFSDETMPDELAPSTDTPVANEAAPPVEGDYSEASAQTPTESHLDKPLHKKAKKKLSKKSGDKKKKKTAKTKAKKKKNKKKHG